ncbi:hypothetical protein LCGC14_0645800 [marine sediment metagenome]|uniref:Transposase IS891/IS1136/IS1341 domain-containing protein n=1 Tax=marine sediment metagenome TaxID=412755 RepID=A0A0F9RHC3_9ZZZZ
MLVYQSYRYELKLNRRLVEQLRCCCGTARFAYNWGLAQQFLALHEGAEFPTAVSLHRQLNQQKQGGFSWMKSVSKWIPQNALRSLDVAWKNKRTRAFGAPRFKRRGQHDSFRVDKPVHVNGRYIQLPKLGRLRTKEPTTKLKGRILSATVSREADRWFCSIAVSRERPDPVPLQGAPVGIDLGIKTFAVLSDGACFHAPKPLKQHLRKIQRLSRQVSRKQQGSANWRKAVLRLAKQHRRVRNIRKDFLHKLTSDLTKTKQVICVEDLNVAGMMRNHKLARAISDLGWGEFKRQLQYKSEWYGGRVITIDRWFPSSKMCSCCGFKLEKLDLGTRVWTCPDRSAELDRDLNAALNILLEGCGKDLIEQYPEFQGNLRLWRSSKSTVSSSEDLGSRNQTSERSKI